MPSGRRGLNRTPAPRELESVPRPQRGRGTLAVAGYATPFSRTTRKIIHSCGVGVDYETRAAICSLARACSVGTIVMTSQGQTWAHSLQPMHTWRSMVQMPMA